MEIIMKAKIEKVENYIKECRSKLIEAKNINNLSVNYPRLTSSAFEAGACKSSS